MPSPRYCVRVGHPSVYFSCHSSSVSEDYWSKQPTLSEFDLLSFLSFSSDEKSAVHSYVRVILFSFVMVILCSSLWETLLALSIAKKKKKKNLKWNFSFKLCVSPSETYQKDNCAEASNVCCQMGLVCHGQRQNIAWVIQSSISERMREREKNKCDSRTNLLFQALMREREWAKKVIVLPTTSF